ncbi:hypothetical protein EHYA_06546 [Embleya hyalina]|uniref:Uncharacterized protein n=1 Tax=Embleya hyalina TaxID=516124 RepID=A0A401YWB4_9ACTN|nr:hypothetical protein EHYA_06546 [Embleya hyalina]
MRRRISGRRIVPAPHNGRVSSQTAAVRNPAVGGDSPTPATEPLGVREPPSGGVVGRRKRADAHPTGPRVRMVLPDGQHLEVTLVSWHQYRDGSWRARVRWPVWGAYGFAADVETRAWAMESFVPASVLGPLDGEDYGTVRHDRPRIPVPKQP